MKFKLERFFYHITFKCFNFLVVYKKPFIFLSFIMFVLFVLVLLQLFKFSIYVFIFIFLTVLFIKFWVLLYLVDKRYPEVLFLIVLKLFKSFILRIFTLRNLVVFIISACLNRLFIGMGLRTLFLFQPTTILHSGFDALIMNLAVFVVTASVIHNTLVFLGLTNKPYLSTEELVVLNHNREQLAKAKFNLFDVPSLPSGAIYPQPDIPLPPFYKPELFLKSKMPVLYNSAIDIFPFILGKKQVLGSREFPEMNTFQYLMYFYSHPCNRNLQSYQLLGIRNVLPKLALRAESEFYSSIGPLSSLKDKKELFTFYEKYLEIFAFVSPTPMEVNIILDVLQSKKKLDPQGELPVMIIPLDLNCHLKAFYNIDILNSVGFVKPLHFGYRPSRDPFLDPIDPILFFYF